MPGALSQFCIIADASLQIIICICTLITLNTYFQETHSVSFFQSRNTITLIFFYKNVVLEMVGSTSRAYRAEPVAEMLITS